MQYSQRSPFLDAIISLTAAALFATGVVAARDALSDPASAARVSGPHMFTPPPDLLGGLAGDTRILLIGADDRKSRGRADTIIVAHIRPKLRRAVLLSIQRDTLVEIPGHRRDKINHAYKFGGVPLLKTTVERLLGERIGHYAKLDFQTFEKAVDDLGGVRIVVADVEGKGRGMNYDDYADKLHIHLKPGEQDLDGKQAIGYVRYRKDSDFKRTDRQRQFLKAAMRQHMSPDHLPGLIKAARRAVAEIDTDIPRGKAVRLLMAVRRIPPESIKTAMLPVIPAPSHGVYYSKLDEKRAAKLQAELREFLDGEGTAPIPLKECAIVVLNGSGTGGAAGNAAARLAGAGARIAAARNADRFDHERTLIRYHSAARGAADEVSHLLGTPAATLREDDDFDAPGAACMIVTLGQDFHAY